jgi:hypothetical protein
MQAKPVWSVPVYLVLAGVMSIGTALAAPVERNAPVQLAALSAPAAPATTAVRTFPAHEAGVRAAAAQGAEPLRRYIFRTRMIHNFYYNDFARDIPGNG